MTRDQVALSADGQPVVSGYQQGSSDAFFEAQLAGLTDAEKDAARKERAGRQIANHLALMRSRGIEVTCAHARGMLNEYVPEWVRGVADPACPPGSVFLMNHSREECEDMVRRGRGVMDGGE